MRKYLVALAVLTVVVAVASTTMAATTYAQSRNDLRLYQLYVRPGGLQFEQNPVGMPGTTGNHGGDGGFDGPLMSAQGRADTGPISDGPMTVAGDSTSFNRGSALVSPTGGTVYTPKQRADREIKGLIRRLD